MRTWLAAFCDPFILALTGTVALASLLPARGAWAPIADGAADAGIVMLFFFHGAKLSRAAILDGARNWKLHLAVLAVTFGLFPLLGLALTAFPIVPEPLAAGLLFLTLLPSTVQSSIAFTAIGRGNVAAAVCSASFSNLLGIFLTPALVVLFMGTSSNGFSFSSAETIVLQLLLPFAAGHGLRRWIGGFVERHKRRVNLLDRGSILLVVYTAFGAAVLDGLWQRLSAADLAVVALLCIVLLALVLIATAALGRLLRFSKEDRIVLLFCGSKKSLASGVPIAGVLFAAAEVGNVILPLMLFHQIQLIACAVIARHYARQREPIPAAAETVSELRTGRG